MRQSHYSITPAVVRHTAQGLLEQALSWKPYGRTVSVSNLLNVLLLVAALRSSLSAVVKRFRFGFSHETARQAVDTNLPDVSNLTQLARDGKCRPPQWLGELPLRRLLNWLAALLQRSHPEEKSIKLGQPLPEIEGLKL